jgi:hypothetical protein
MHFCRDLQRRFHQWHTPPFGANGEITLNLDGSRTGFDR